MSKTKPVDVRTEAEVGGVSVLEDRPLLLAWRRFAEIRSNPFLTPEWFQSWIECNPGEEASPIVWRRDGRVQGVLPLVCSRRGPWRILRFAGAEVGDWFGPACEVGDESAMAAACSDLLGRHPSSWSLLHLARIDRGGVWPSALWESDAALAKARPGRLEVIPFIALGAGGYEAYLAGRSRNFRSQLGRRRRRLERDHRLVFRQTTDPERLGPDMEIFRRLHDERWRARGGSGAFPGSSWEAHCAFASRALERGWLRLWTAEVDGEPGASWYGWRIGERYCFGLSGLRRDLEPLALGTVLLAHTIEHAAAEGANLYDLMLGDDAYKRRFETGRRQVESWQLGRSGSATRAVADVGLRVRRALGRVRHR